MDLLEDFFFDILLDVVGWEDDTVHCDVDSMLKSLDGREGGAEVEEGGGIWLVVGNDGADEDDGFREVCFLDEAGGVCEGVGAVENDDLIGLAGDAFVEDGLALGIGEVGGVFEKDGLDVEVEEDLGLGEHLRQVGLGEGVGAVILLRL